MSEVHVDATYWGDRLEVSTDVVLQQHAEDSYMSRWVTGLSPRCRALLAEHFGIDTEDMTINEVREAILDFRDDLVPFLLVDAASQGKRTYAIVEVGRAKLTPAAFESCRVKDGEDKFDRNALMWRLYLQDEANLELVFHLDRTQRKGFARMVITDAPGPNGKHPDAFFTREVIQPILDDHEEGKTPKRNSHCAEILSDGGSYQVFIKRDNKTSFVSHGPKNVFGFEREWIILEFTPDLHRVLICSESPDVPLVLANLLAGEFFDDDVEYENEAIETSAEHVSAFIEALVDEPHKLPLVEVVAKNSGLAGSPQLRLNSQENESIAPALKQFAATYGDPLEDPEDIESLKVLAFDKRVKVVFEKADDDGEAFIVRYADQPLNGQQRRAFEKRMEDDYGITVLSTEKKYAR